MKTLAAILLLTLPVHAGLIYYDGQDFDSTFLNTFHDPSGMTYTMANSSALPVTGGRRVVNGGGDPAQNDYFSLSLAPGDNWDDAGLLDTGSGSVGGGNVSGTLYLSFLLRSQNAVDGSIENKSISPGGAYSAFQLALVSGSGAAAKLGMGNHWNAWAYSIFGVAGDKDLVQGSGGSTWLEYNTDVHWMVARIDFAAGADDNFTIWLDPNPDDLDAQATGIRRASGTGDLSFNQVSYRAGNQAGINIWEFDEVRFGTTWADMQAVAVVPEASTASILALGFALLLRRFRA
jgi:hypothetical protein